MEQVADLVQVGLHVRKSVPSANCCPLESTNKAPTERAQQGCREQGKGGERELALC